MKKFLTYTLSAAALFTAAAFAVFPVETAAAVSAAAENCLHVMIPSLFAMAVMSELLVKTDVYRIFGKAGAPLARHIFRINGEMLAVFVISCTAGYPAGAVLISAAYNKGDISHEQARELYCWCFGAGPAFIFGAVGNNVFGSAAAGTAIFLSCVSANIILGIYFAAGKKLSSKAAEKTKLQFTPQIFCDSVEKGGRSILKLCAVILFVSAALSVPETLGITAKISAALGKAFSVDPYYVQTFLRSAADVTNLSRLVTDDLSLVPMASALLSFGGISVFLQIRAVCGSESGIDMGLLVLYRAISAVLSFLICSILCRVMFTAPVNAVVSAMADIREVRSSSPLPSLLLLGMTVMLLTEGKGSAYSKRY